MKPCWHRSSPFPSQSGRQESNLPSTAYQTVASPLGFGPVVSALYGTRTRLACSTGRSPHPLRHRAEECPAGVAPPCPTRQVGASAARPRHGQQGRKESNPLAPALEAGCSPGSTPLTVSGRDRTRTCKGFRLACFPSRCHRACWLALPNQAVPAGLEPATVWLTASRTTVVLRDSRSLSGQNRNRT